MGSVEVEIRSRPPGPVLDPRPVADWRPRVRVGHTHSAGAGGTQLARANDMSFYCYTKLPNLLCVLGFRIDFNSHRLIQLLLFRSNLIAKIQFKIEKM